MNLAAQPISFGLRAGAPLDNIGGNVNHWEFPILVKYRFSGAPLIHPYLAAGPSFNHVSDPGMGASLEVRALILRVSPELRYTRWRDKNIDLAPVIAAYHPTKTNSSSWSALPSEFLHSSALFA